MGRNISIIIPAFNENDIIADTIKSLHRFPEISEIIVVDDGSTDDTSECAVRTGALVWKHPRNLGKGAALNTGSALASGDVIVFLDADLGSSAGEAHKLWKPVVAGEADCAIAHFPKANKKGGFGLVKRLAQWGVYHFGGTIISAALSGQRALTRPALEAIFPFSDGYGVEVGATIQLLKKGFRIQEIEVAMTHRETGRDWAGFRHRGKQFGHIIKTLAKEALK